MKVFIGQIYVEPGVSFPFSHQMQRWMHERLSVLVSPTDEFTARYGSGFELMVRISAKSGRREVEIVGPTVFKKENEVEYTLFLPYDVVAEKPDSRRAAAEMLIEGLLAVFQTAQLDAGALAGQKESMVDYLATEATMLKGAWELSTPK
jgi:hypothetical protein